MKGRGRRKESGRGRSGGRVGGGGGRVKGRGRRKESGSGRSGRRVGGEGVEGEWEGGQLACLIMSLLPQSCPP